MEPKREYVIQIHTDYRDNWRYETGKWEVFGPSDSIYDAKRWKTRKGPERWINDRPGYGEVPNRNVIIVPVNVTYLGKTKKVRRITRA